MFGIEIHRITGTPFGPLFLMHRSEAVTLYKPLEPGYIVRYWKDRPVNSFSSRLPRGRLNGEAPPVPKLRTGGALVYDRQR